MNYRRTKRAGLVSLAFAIAITLAAMPTLAANMAAQMGSPNATPTAAGYTFKLAGTKAEGGGKNLVAVQLTHDGKPVTGAIVIQSRADMGPMNMAAMTAPITFTGEQPPGTYRFEVTNGPVWKKPDNWALSFSAKVQGVSETVNGSVTVKLTP